MTRRRTVTWTWTFGTVIESTTPQGTRCTAMSLGIGHRALFLDGWEGTVPFIFDIDPFEWRPVEGSTR